MNFIPFCCHIFISNDSILFLPHPDLSPQPCLQLPRSICQQLGPLSAGPLPRLQGSRLTLAHPQHLNSLLVSPWPPPCLHTPSLSWLMEWCRHPGYQRTTEGGREAEGRNSTEKQLEKIASDRRARGFELGDLNVSTTLKKNKKIGKGYIISSQEEDICFSSSFLHPS